MKFYWHILLTTVSITILLLKENSCVPAIRPLSQRGIIYPAENWDDCFIDDNSTQPGLCKTLEECPDVLKKWNKEHIYPKTCYFIKKEQFVCCPITSINTLSSTTPGDNIFIEFSSSSEMPVKKQKPSELECDLQNQRKFEMTVVNGETTKRNEFPFMAALGWKSNSDNKIWYPCGGVLISQKFVLTAAHCAEIGGETPSFVLVGSSNLTNTAAGTIKIKQFIKFPGYNATTVYNDIALVELEQEINNSIACLWTPAVIPFTTATALSYGHTLFAGVASSSLVKASLQLIPKTECQKFYALDDKLKSIEIVDTHICAGDHERIRDICQGDSGGPLIMEFEKIFYVVGITSFGLDCGGLPPSIYTRISAYVDWIESIIWPDIDVRFD